MSSCEELAATAKRRMVEMLSLTSEGSAACWRSKGEDRLAQSGPAFSSSGRGERKTAGSEKTSKEYAPERSGGRVQNGCVSRDAANTHGWRQPVRVCLGSALATHTSKSSRFQRVACAGLSIREKAGKASMLEAATSWVTVARANAASAKAGNGRATNITFCAGKATEATECSKRTGKGAPRAKRTTQECESELAHNQMKLATLVYQRVSVSR